MKSEESGRSEAASAESGTVREVPFAELNGSGLELPDYPELARRWGWEGIVVVRIQIGPEGNVREAELLRSSGYDLLDRAALKTVAESWTFNPPGREVETVKEFEFLLKSAR
ncbi:MAG: energy transducer TonB [Spirochaetota bacterium]